MKKQAQTWSLDIMIAFFLFIIISMSFFYIISTKSDPTSSLDELVSEARTITDVLISSNPSLLGDCTFIAGNKISKADLQACAQDYELSKTLLGVKKDYCIHFEDSQGNLIDISGITGLEGIGLGNPNINYTILDQSGTEVTVLPCSGNQI